MVIRQLFQLIKYSEYDAYNNQVLETYNKSHHFLKEKLLNFWCLKENVTSQRPEQILVLNL